MILKQYYLGCLAHASYLLGDEASSTAVIVDPQRDAQHCLAETPVTSCRMMASANRLRANGCALTGELPAAYRFPC